MDREGLVWIKTRHGCVLESSVIGMRVRIAMMVVLIRPTSSATITSSIGHGGGRDK